MNIIAQKLDEQLFIDIQYISECSEPVLVFAKIVIVNFAPHIRVLKEFKLLQVIN